MARFVQVGQVVISGTPISTREKAENIGGARYKLPEGKEKIYVGGNIEIYQDNARVTEARITDIDYSGGRLNIEGIDKTKDVIVKYKWRPHNTIANITDYNIKTDREERTIQTIDMDYAIEDLGVSKFSGSLTAIIESSIEEDILMNAFNEGKKLDLEFYMGEYKGRTITASFKDIEIEHPAGNTVTIKANFTGVRA